jgi:UDP-GlcNAc:undecaprenyl-phosphate GlcNAc-1-phosphate transferase
MILVPLFALGYPIFDTLLAIARRTVRGQPLFASDRDHIHHRLLSRGSSPSAAALQIYAASILVSLACIAAVIANHFVLGLGVLGVLAMALFSARVLGYLEWGGWTARWSGRADTRVLHAAAHLARLKIEQARSQDDCVQALGAIGPEISAKLITLVCDARESRWGEVVAESPVALEMALSDDRCVRIVLSGPNPLDVERSQIVEELCRQIDARLNEIAGNQPRPT